jgi:pyrroline-5-carboxylate reductase
MEQGLKKFLLVGYGNMGSAMISPLVGKFDITVVTPNSTPSIDVKLFRSLSVSLAER